MGIAKSRRYPYLYPLSGYSPQIPERRNGRRSSGSRYPPSVQQEYAIPNHFKVEVDDEVYEVKVEPLGGGISVSEASPKKPNPESVKGAVCSSMQGMILSLKVKVEDTVSEGDTVAIIEAMKMENAVHAPTSGIVKEIFVSEGDTVSPGDIIMSIE